MFRLEAPLSQQKVNQHRSKPMLKCSITQDLNGVHNFEQKNFDLSFPIQTSSYIIKKNRQTEARLISLYMANTNTYQPQHYLAAFLQFDDTEKNYRRIFLDVRCRPEHNFASRQIYFSLRNYSINYNPLGFELHTGDQFKLGTKKFKVICINHRNQNEMLDQNQNAKLRFIQSLKFLEAKYQVNNDDLCIVCDKGPLNVGENLMTESSNENLMSDCTETGNKQATEQSEFSWSTQSIYSSRQTGYSSSPQSSLSPFSSVTRPSNLSQSPHFVYQTPTRPSRLSQSPHFAYSAPTRRSRQPQLPHHSYSSPNRSTLQLSQTQPTTESTYSTVNVNPFFTRLCDCNSSIHLNCLKNRASQQIQSLKTQKTHYYLFQKWICSSCKMKLPKCIIRPEYNFYRQVSNNCVFNLGLKRPYMIIQSEVILPPEGDNVPQKQEIWYIIPLNQKHHIDMGTDARSDIQLQSVYCASNNHAQICYFDGKVYLKDLQSKFGTYVLLDKRMEISGSASIQVDGHFYKFQVEMDNMKNVDFRRIYF